ncbi:bestrophin family protein [Mucilaginibacter auburnensis]|uniref:Putative membrane protein n=1 Tax=Mucilaginibacter auburnensis TaxID=1457233 RepID=A0A2H9VUL6_9SPHI|nr:bestrophin family ion channel [Mucilaginibacter auburnensis]PJJ84505.1 putative membrane protein [Mucilaginibacter auburnensis]
MLLKRNIPFSYVMGKIKMEMALLAAYSSLVYIAHTAYNFPGVSIPIAIPAILGTIISLLLAFRSNQAYDRWWEARTIWGAIVNDSRSLARQILTFVDNDTYQNEDRSPLRERIIKRQIAWCYALTNHLRGQNTCEPLNGLIAEEEKRAVMTLDNTPMALLEQHGNDIRLLLKLGWINQYQQVALDETLTRFSNTMGACERIKNTVFPVTYSLYIHVLVIMFALMMPFSLIEHVGIFQIPLVVAISASFFLIEKMAIHLQDPFENKPTDTPMTAISKKIDRDLHQLMHDEYEKSNEQNVQQANVMFYIL